MINRTTCLLPEPPLDGAPATPLHIGVPDTPSLVSTPSQLGTIQYFQHNRVPVSNAIPTRWRVPSGSRYLSSSQACTPIIEGGFHYPSAAVRDVSVYGTLPKHLNVRRTRSANAAVLPLVVENEGIVHHQRSIIDCYYSRDMYHYGNMGAATNHAPLNILGTPTRNHYPSLPRMRRNGFNRASTLSRRNHAPGFMVPVTAEPMLV